MPIIPFPFRVCDSSVSIFVSSETILTTAHTAREVMIQLADLVWSKLGYSGGRLWLLDADSGRLLQIARWQTDLRDLPPSAGNKIALLEKGQDLPGWAFEQSEVGWMGLYVVSNHECHAESRVCVPLRCAGIVNGILELISKNADEPNTNRLLLLQQSGQWIGSLLHQMGCD